MAEVEGPRTHVAQAVQVSPPKPRSWQALATEGCADEGAGRQPIPQLDAESVHQMVRSAASKVLSAVAGVEAPLSPDGDALHDSLRLGGSCASRSARGACEGGPIIIPHQPPSASYSSSATAAASAERSATAANAALVDELRRELAARDVEVAQLRTQVEEKCVALEMLKEEHARGRSEQTMELQSLKERMSKLEQMLLEAAMAKQAEMLTSSSPDHRLANTRSEASPDPSPTSRQLQPLLSSYGSGGCVAEEQRSPDLGAPPSARSPLRCAPVAGSGSLRAVSGRPERACLPAPGPPQDPNQHIRRSLTARSAATLAPAQCGGSAHAPSLRWQAGTSRSTSPPVRLPLGLASAAASGTMPSTPRRLPMGVALMPPPVPQRR